MIDGKLPRRTGEFCGGPIPNSPPVFVERLLLALLLLRRKFIFSSEVKTGWKLGAGSGFTDGSGVQFSPNDSRSGEPILSRSRLLFSRSRKFGVESNELQSEQDVAASFLNSTRRLLS